MRVLVLISVLLLVAACGKTPTAVEMRCTVTTDTIRTTTGTPAYIATTKVCF